MAVPPIEVRVAADTAQAEAALDRVGDRAVTAGNRVQGSAAKMAAGTGAANQSFSVLGGQSRMLTQQLSQVAQQATATGQVGQALAVQAADIGLAFGTVGTIVGALVGVTLPSLIQMFNKTGEEAADLASRVEEAVARIDELRLQARELRLGVSPEELALMDAVAEAQERYNAALRMSQAPREETAAIGRRQLETAREELRVLEAHLRELRGVQDEIEEIKDGSASLLDNFTALIPVAERFAVLTGQAADNVLTAARNAAIAEATRGERGRGAAGPGGPLLGSAGRALASMGGVFIPGSDGDPSAGGGGGGGGVDTFGADLEALQERLMTETELAQSAYEQRLEMLREARERELLTNEEYNDLEQRLRSEHAELAQSAYEQRLEMLREARERELLTNEEYNDLEQRLRSEHAEKMLDIDVWRHGNALDQTEAFFGRSAAALMSGNEKMVEIGRKFAAIEATINAGRAFAQVASDPSLPWFAKIPAAIGVASAISQFANQSGIGGGGGGGVAAEGSQPAAESPLTQNVAIDLIGASGTQVDQFQQFADTLNEAARQGLLTNISVRGV